MELIMGLEVELKCSAGMFPPQDGFKMPFSGHRVGQLRSEDAIP